MSERPKARPPYRDVRARLSSPQRSEQATESTAPTEPLKTTLEEGLKLLAERRNGRRITYEVDTPDGRPCWVAWERFVTLGPADSWEDALGIALDQPVVARDDAAELRSAIREWVEATDDAEMFELDQSNAYGTDHADAEDRVEAAAQALRRLAGGEAS